MSKEQENKESRDVIKSVDTITAKVVKSSSDESVKEPSAKKPSAKKAIS